MDSLENEKYNLLTRYKILQKDFQEIQREIKQVKVSGEDQGVPTDFTISSNDESASTYNSDTGQTREWTRKQ